LNRPARKTYQINPEPDGSQFNPLFRNPGTLIRRFIWEIFAKGQGLSALQNQIVLEMISARSPEHACYPEDKTGANTYETKPKIVVVLTGAFYCYDIFFDFRMVY
jgi:hypothetical protein